MDRVVYIKDTLRNNKKYILSEEYDGFGIYQEKCPSGLFVHQSWLVYNGKTGFICQSFNNYCKEELMDRIDNYNKKKRFGLHGYMADKSRNIYGMHPNVKTFKY